MILQTRQETDERLVRAIYFDHESIALIRKLYNLLDKNSDGVLSKEDFVEYNTMFEDKQVCMYVRSYVGIDSALCMQVAKWQELRVHFDDDCNGEITLEEVELHIAPSSHDKYLINGEDVCMLCSAQILSISTY